MLTENFPLSKPNDFNSIIFCGIQNPTRNDIDKSQKSKDQQFLFPLTSWQFQCGVQRIISIG